MNNERIEIYSQLRAPLIRGPRGALFLSALIFKNGRLGERPVCVVSNELKAWAEKGGVEAQI